MKRLTIILSLILFPFFLQSCMSAGEGGSKDGIQFFEGTWAQALQKAKAEQKPIFIDIYASWCGPCKLLKKKTFPDKEVGTFFNANYICMSFDGEQGEGVMMAQKFQISGYPTLIVVNKDGGVVDMQTGFLPPEDFLAWGKHTIGK